MAQQHTPPNLRGAVDLSALRNRHQGPAAASPAGAGQASGEAQPGSPALVVEASDANFSAIVELSTKVPVIVEVFAGSPTQSLATQVESLAGRFVLAQVDSSTSPQLVSALQVSVAPTVFAVIAGRPAPLYEGELPVEQLSGVLEQVAQLAAQNGVTGSVDVGSEGPGVARRRSLCLLCTRRRSTRSRWVISMGRFGRTGRLWRRARVMRWPRRVWLRCRC